MEDMLLEELIEKTNKIYDSTQYDVVYECMSLLGISISEYEQDEIEYKTPYYIEPKDIYTKRIIEEIEQRISDSQKDYFYSHIAEAYLRYTHNDTVKKEALDNIIIQGKHADYYVKISSFTTHLISSINDDNYKIGFISKYNSVMHTNSLRLIIQSLSSDQNKASFMDAFTEEPDELGKLILSISDDTFKLELYEKYKEVLEDELEFDELVCSLKDDALKLEALERINYKSRLVMFEKLLYSLNNTDSLLSIWDKVDARGKSLIIYKIKDPNKRFELFKKLNESLESLNNNKPILKIVELIKELPEENIKYIVNECPNIKFSYTDSIVLLRHLPSEEAINFLRTRGNKKLSHFFRKEKILSPNEMLENLDLFLEKEEVENKETIKEHINYLFQSNNDIIYTIDWNILRSPYIETLGLDKINVIGSFESLTRSTLDMSKKEYEAFYRVLTHYIEKEGEIDWQYAAYQIMQEIYFNKVDNKDICNLIDNFDNVDISNLLYILLNGDNFGIKSQEDINNYATLVKEKCDEDIINGTLDQKKDAIFIKFFGLSDYNSLLRGFRGQIKNGMGRIYNLYHKDINLIDNEELKQLFKFVETVTYSTSEEELIEIYNSQNEFSHIDTYKLERLLKNELLKLYNKELLQLDNLKQNEEGLYEAGVDFSILATSIGAYVKNNPDNYMEDWNKPSLASQHFCASYIRNDMLGTAPIPHFMYGFTSMEPYSLLLSGSTDIYSSGAAFISKAFNGEEYLGPDRQINETAYNQKYPYNEMDFRRIQGGKKKQPDYIIVFRRNGVIDNINEAKQASLDWNGLPIVVIDVDLCLKNEREKLDRLLNEYYHNPTVDIFNFIKTKVMNNRVTNKEFASDINLEELENMIVNNVSNERVI